MLTDELARKAQARAVRLGDAASEAEHLGDLTAPILEIASELAQNTWVTIEAALMAEKRTAAALTPIDKLLRAMVVPTPARAGEKLEVPLNDFLVGVQVGSGAISFRPLGVDGPELMIDAERALGLAAWLAALADPEGTKFPRIFAAVLNS